MKTKAILLMVFFLGWVTTGWAADHVKGDGKLTSKKISVADYNEIKVDGVIDFNYEQSDDPSTVEVTVDQNLHPYVNIEVKDRVANSLVQLKETVTVGKLDLNVSGSANMVVNHLEADKIECDIDGSGSITIKKGNAKEGDYSIVSSGDIHAFGLAVPLLSCKVTGNGLAEVHATDNLKANVIGKGNIRYKGPTAVQQRIIGKGTVEEVKE